MNPYGRPGSVKRRKERRRRRPRRSRKSGFRTGPRPRSSACERGAVDKLMLAIYRRRQLESIGVNRTTTQDATNSQTGPTVGQCSCDFGPLSSSMQLSPSQPAVNNGQLRSIPAPASRLVSVECLPGTLLRKLQSVQNATARLITGTRRRDHITTVLRELHWPPIRERIKFKVASLVRQSLSG